jgi:hypothetical protein
LVVCRRVSSKIFKYSSSVKKLNLCKRFTFCIFEVIPAWLLRIFVVDNHIHFLDGRPRITNFVWKRTEIPDIAIGTRLMWPTLSLRTFFSQLLLHHNGHDSFVTAISYFHTSTFKIFYGPKITFKKTITLFVRSMVDVSGLTLHLLSLSSRSGEVNRWDFIKPFLCGFSSIVHYFYIHHKYYWFIWVLKKLILI